MGQIKQFKVAQNKLQLSFLRVTLGLQLNPLLICIRVLFSSAFSTHILLTDASVRSTGAWPLRSAHLFLSVATHHVLFGESLLFALFLILFLLLLDNFLQICSPHKYYACAQISNTFYELQMSRFYLYQNDVWFNTFYKFFRTWGEISFKICFQMLLPCIFCKNDILLRKISVSFLFD